MEATQTILLALIQGITEFLPISSSGHLVLTPLLFGYALQSLAFDVAVHLGTLSAVMLYFRRDLAAITAGLLGSLRQRSLTDANAQLGWLIVLGTVPVLLLGLPLKQVLEFLRGDEQLIALVIATTSIVFGLLLWWVDRSARRSRNEHSLNWRSALFIGLMQALAIIPGVSRSGITMTAGRMLGLTRQAASRFSFLLAIPTILLAGALATLDLLGDSAPVDWRSLLLGGLLSFAVAYLAIHSFLHFIERIGMLPFVVYRVLLGVLIFILLSA